MKVTSAQEFTSGPKYRMIFLMETNTTATIHTCTRCGRTGEYGFDPKTSECANRRACTRKASTNR